MKFSSSDGVIWRYLELAESLGSARGGRSVLQSGLKFSRKCGAIRFGRAGPIVCQSKQWTPKRFGKPPHYAYLPVCRQCGKEWPVEVSDIRSGQVHHQHSSVPDSLHDLATLARILGRLEKWTARVWRLRVLGPTVSDIEALAKVPRIERYKRVAGELDLRSRWTWEDTAAAAAEQWPRKHAQVDGGFFTPRYCRRLVYAARDQVERRLCRAKLWDHDETGGECLHKGVTQSRKPRDFSAAPDDTSAISSQTATCQP